MPRIFLVLAAILVSFHLSLPAHAEGLPKPEGSILLTVTGKIALKNDARGAVFDRKMLMALGMQKVKATLPWEDETIIFEGASGKALMEKLGVRSGMVKALALNNYVAEIPVEDFLEKGIILAMKANGKIMGVRDKGPLYIVYPFDDHPDLKNDAYYVRTVWQLKEIQVE